MAQWFPETDIQKDVAADGDAAVFFFQRTENRVKVD